jgi:hypothetical protein
MRVLPTAASTCESKRVKFPREDAVADVKHAIGAIFISRLFQLLKNNQSIASSTNKDNCSNKNVAQSSGQTRTSHWLVADKSREVASRRALKPIGPAPMRVCSCMDVCRCEAAAHTALVSACHTVGWPLNTSGMTRVNAGRLLHRHTPCFTEVQFAAAFPGLLNSVTAAYAARRPE